MKKFSCTQTLSSFCSCCRMDFSRLDMRGDPGLEVSGTGPGSLSTKLETSFSPVCFLKLQRFLLIQHSSQRSAVQLFMSEVRLYEPLPQFHPSPSFTSWKRNKQLVAPHLVRRQMTATRLTQRFRCQVQQFCSSYLDQASSQLTFSSSSARHTTLRAVGGAVRAGDCTVPHRVLSGLGSATAKGWDATPKAGMQAQPQQDFRTYSTRACTVEQAMSFQ